MQGRGTLDVSMRLNKGDLRLMLALSYRGYRVTAPPGWRQFDPLGETLGHHYFLFNVGLGG